jgi:nicotinate-nucleotide pyrophosphorylase (carboxylating)
VTLQDELAAAGLDPAEVQAAIDRALAEDIPTEDVTSVATIAADARGEGVFAAREDGTIAGLGIAALVFETVMGDTVSVTDRVPDGTRVAAGDVVMRVAGPTRGLLTAERTALNFACHLSGVATATAAWVDALEGTSARVLDTRKTLPGWRALQKYAVRCGGGLNHRMSLSDRAMVKDNHVVAAGGVAAAFKAVREQFPDLDIEVEADTLHQVREVLDAGADLILLDNFTPAETEEAVALVAGRAALESSGRLTLANARVYADTGVDYLAVGALTHSSPILDIGLDLRAGN